MILTDEKVKKEVFFCQILFVAVFCTGWTLYFLPAGGMDYFVIQALSIIETVGLLLVAAPRLRPAVPLTAL